MLEENKQDILSKNYLLNKRKNVRMKNRNLAIKHRIFVVGCLIGLVIMVSAYFCLPISDVYGVKVSGNQYFNDEYYLALSGLSKDDKYLLANPKKVEKRLKDSTIVKDAKVKRADHRMLEIEITENTLIGYIYTDEPEVVLSDGSLVEFKDEYLSLICEIPYIDGYSAEELALFAKDFEKLDAKMINEISEIHRYPFSYDDQMMEIVMRDGSYVYVSHLGLYLLNEYYTVKSGIKDKDQDLCIFFDELTNSGYTSECPYWREEEVPEVNENEDLETLSEETDAED